MAWSISAYHTKHVIVIIMNVRMNKSNQPNSWTTCANINAIYTIMVRLWFINVYNDWCLNDVEYKTLTQSWLHIILKLHYFLFKRKERHR